MRAKEIGEYLDRLAPPKGGEEGFKWGDPQAEVSGVLITWMATMGAIEEAVRQGCNLIISHEELHYPYSSQRPGLENYAAWPVNRLRLTALAKHDMAVYRSHGTLDRFCILEDFTNLLGLGEPVLADGFVKVFGIAPVKAGDLVARVKEATGASALRVAGDPGRMVSRVGCPWGGVGLSVNIGHVNALIEKGAEALIAGETDEYAMWYALDAGVVMIETSHAVSENPGLRHFAAHLGGTFPGLKVVFYEVPMVWECL